MATPIWGLAQPAGTDAANTLDTTITGNMNLLDNATQNVTMLRKGTFALRPSAATAKSGCYYLATDTGVLYLSDGTNWITVNDNTDPIGTVKGYVGGSDPADTRYVICDGRAISRTTYATLFALVSTTYGTGNGSTTFNIPDLRGRTLVGVDGAAARMTANDTLGASGGEEKHTLTSSELPGNNSYMVSPSSGSVFGTDAPAATPQFGPAGAGRALYATVGTGSSISYVSGAGAAHNVMQPYQVANYILRIA